mgnify:CR=1 FL=1
MNTIFTTDDPEDYIEKINLDELYEKKKQHDISTTKNYKTQNDDHRIVCRMFKNIGRAVNPLV